MDVGSFLKLLLAAIVCASSLIACGYTYNEENAKLAQVHSQGVSATILDSAAVTHFRSKKNVVMYKAADSALRMIRSKCARVLSADYLGQQAALHPDFDPVIAFDYTVRMDCGWLKLNLSYVVTDHGYELVGFNFNADESNAHLLQQNALM